jgi:septum formation protein
MTTEISLVRTAPGDLAAHWRSEVQAHLHPHENVLAALEVDLDARLHFAKALVVATSERQEEVVNVSEVLFKPLSIQEIRHYLACGEHRDKAGAYGIQGRAAMFVQEIRGSYSGIMGLPMFETAQLLRSFGFTV